MRAINFRVWDKALQQMIFQHPSMVIRLSGKVTDGSTTPDIELLQFTGLKDKNGVEIYEGDVYHQGDPNIKYVVEFQRDQYVGRQVGNQSTAGLAAWHGSHEVLGNIYEHPELLNVTANAVSTAENTQATETTK